MRRRLRFTGDAAFWRHAIYILIGFDSLLMELHDTEDSRRLLI